MRPLSTFASLTLVTAAIGIACGEVARNDGTVSHITAVPAESAQDVANVASSAAKVAICHFEEETGTSYDILVPEVAAAAHFNHGDSPGPCAVTCPCYTAEQIDSLSGVCSLDCLPLDGGLYLLVECGGGGSDTAYFLGLNEGDASCNGEDDEAMGLTFDELQSCQAIIQATGICPDPS